MPTTLDKCTKISIESEMSMLKCCKYELLNVSPTQASDKPEIAFSSLEFIAKRLNRELSNASDFTSPSPNDKTNSKSDEHEGTLTGLELDECITIINLFSSHNSVDNIFDLCDTTSGIDECFEAINKISNHIRGYPCTLIDEMLTLQLDLEDEKDRELMVTFSRCRLPDIKILTIKNIYECDQDFEEFLTNSLKKADMLELL